MSYAGGSGNVAVATKTFPAKRKPGNPAGHKSLTESPLPYRQEDPSEEDTRYCDSVKGIVPGYAGHRPQAQHNYGRSSFGDPGNKSHAGYMRQTGHMQMYGDMGTWVDDVSPEDDNVGTAGPQAGHPDIKKDGGVWSEGLPDYSQQVGGVLPGYGGHVPRALHKYGASAKGNTPPFGTSNEQQEVAELRQLFSRSPEVRGLEKGDYHRADPNDDGEEWWPQAPPRAAIEGQMYDFRDVRNGVLPKYAGHIPRSKDKYGASAMGKTRTIEGQDPGLESNSGVVVPGFITGQLNRQNTKHEVAFKPTMRIDGNGVIPGYRGHVPNVVNAIGMSTFLSGPGYTEIKVEDMEKMGGLGDLGDSAAAYGCNDWGASGFSDGAADMDDLGDGPMADGHASSVEKGAAAQGGHADQYTYGDKMADEAAAAKKAAAVAFAKREAAKRAARGF